MLTIFTTIVVCLLAAFTVDASWVDNAALRSSALQRTTPTTTSSTAFPTYIINLDLPPAQRWTAIASLPKYQALAPKALAYLQQQVPPAVLPLLEKILSNVPKYFGAEFGGEMVGLGKALAPAGLKLGDIVAFNLIMQLVSVSKNIVLTTMK